ncbi:MULTISPECIES: HNH endonuclease [Nocardia]|uniref:HNH endonuclease n=1 Tax=Nocardia TaxID=1817 RepID=UPI002457D0BD|nr:MULTISPECIES: HNH endonuclease signature motif containing protein [Nocardia]
MTVHPNPRNLVRQMLPKKAQPKRPNPAVVREVVGAIRCGEMTVAQGARHAGCNPDSLADRVWKETKRDVFARDLSCILCGSVVQLDAHHRRRRGAGGSSDPLISFGMANLVTLCRTHHNQVEQNPNLSRAKGLRLDEGDVPSASKVWRRGRWVLLDNAGGVTPIEGGAT